jgi:hypothetical protein
MAEQRESADGDLVRAMPKIPVPDEVQEAVRTLIRWAGDDPGRGRNMRAAIRTTPPGISAAPSRRLAAMTRSCS